MGGDRETGIEVGALPDPQSTLEHEARVVGLREFSTPTLEAVNRRRSQLWTIAFSALVCLSVAVALLTTEGAHHLGFANRAGFRIGTIVLVVGLAAYVVEKERHLRRLANLLVDERVLAAGLSNRLKELAVLYEAGKAMNSVLVLDEVLELILSSAFELLRTSSGSITLVEQGGELREACRSGDDDVPFELAESFVKRVVAEGEPLLVEGKVTEKEHTDSQSTVCVPLVHRGSVLGALTLSGRSEHVYSEHDLRAVSLFAEHAAIAVANARLYEAEHLLTSALSHQVVHDPLTGAANRVLVNENLSKALARMGREKSAVAVLFIDIDDFKLVNDELGHAAGDMVLTAITRRLSDSMRPSDMVGRVGGDEFVIVCQDVVPEDGVPERIANRVLRELREPLSTPFGNRILTASIGIASCDSGHPMSPDDLIRAADSAMYMAKMSGKARVVSAVDQPLLARGGLVRPAANGQRSVDQF